MADRNEGEILFLKGYPFYMKQPTAKMNDLFMKYELMLRDVLGEDVVSVYSIGSGAIPGMVGSPMIDLILAMKNYPPTEEQLTKLKSVNLGLIGDGKSPHDPNDTWLQNLDFPSSGDFEAFKVNGAFPPDGYLGRLSVHVVHYKNQFIGKALCFIEFLKQNKEAFNKYRDVKIEGARLQSSGGDAAVSANPSDLVIPSHLSDAVSGPSPFIKYKMYKAAAVSELMQSSAKWREEGNFVLPQELTK